MSLRADEHNAHHASHPAGRPVPMAADYESPASFGPASHAHTRPRVQTRSGSRRDSGVTALVLGFFAVGWFSWGPADASDAMSTAMIVGSGAALVVAVLGALRVIRSPRNAGPLRDPAVDRRYGIVVGIEFALAAMGAVALAAIGVPAYIPVWICGVVGVHFFALAPVLQAPALRWLGAVVTTVAIGALLLGVLTAVTPSSVTGSGTGLALLACAILALVGRAPQR